ncbi:MAG: multicopper oxidase domain-containing protein [Vicinamibacterales bacterium]
MTTAALLAGRVGLAVFASTLTVTAAAADTPPSHGHDVAVNDNRRAAGTLIDGTWTVALRAARGRWRPAGADGPTLIVDAFGERDQPLSVPAPLLRVTEGATLDVTVANDLAAPLRVHGLCARDGSPCAPLDVPPGATRQVRFAAGRAGTYHYWATALGAPVPFRELAGAFVVDPPGADPTADRVLVITEWSSLKAADLQRVLAADDIGEAFVALQPGVAFMVNGLGWPATERLTYRLGDRVRWRVLNLSSQPHPMHLHGFYFDVERLGDGRRDDAPGPTTPRRVVTQVLPPAGTMTMAWTPERPGHWLFHCHLMAHVSPDRRVPGAPERRSGDHHEVHDHGADASLGMSGLIVGVTVLGAGDDAAPVATPRPARRLTLRMHAAPPDVEGRPIAGFALEEDGSAATPPSSPGPTLVLRQGEPVEITLDNALGEPTAIHWHGIELESYYDGVHGFSGIGPRRTPMISAGERFVVRFTPPRAGTFIYHTHLHDHRQLSAGLYGAIVVVAPGEHYDPAADHVLVLGRSGQTSGALAIPDGSTPAVLNGQRAPRLIWTAGARHRVRLVNISADDLFAVALTAADGPVRWTPVAKDGAPLPVEARTPVDARQTIAVGETYDYEITLPPGRRHLWLEVRTPAGQWQLQAHVVVR